MAEPLFSKGDSEKTRGPKLRPVVEAEIRQVAAMLVGATEVMKRMMAEMTIVPTREWAPTKREQSRGSLLSGRSSSF